MNPQNELFDAIENYLNKGMSEHEHVAFEERMAQDKDLADKVEEVRASNEAIYYASLAELKSTIGQDIKNIKYKPPIDWKKAGIISVVSFAILSVMTTYFVSKDNATIQENKTESKLNGGTQERILSEVGENKTLKANSTSGLNSSQSSNTKAILTDKLSNTKSSKADSIQTTSAFVLQKNSVSDNKTQPDQTESIRKNLEIPVLNENKVLCDKSFKINTEASCKEKETGSISIISDGAYTYTYHIDIQSKTGSNGLFPNLSPGVYELLVTYDKECRYKKKVTVGEKWCAMNNAYSFNPDYNEKWIVNYETGASGTFTIYDKSGRDIYSNTFGNGNEEWNGNDRQGIPVSVGVYFAFINYSDGRKEKVELTIVR